MVPLLAPLLAVLLVAALNPRPSLSLRLLTSRTIALPLGVWLALGGVGGAALSALATSVALRQGRRPSPREGAERFEAPWSQQQPWSEPEWPGEQQEPPRRPAAAPREAGPTRAPGEPAPTVSVPFRVIRQPAGAGGRQATGATATAQAQAGPEGSDDWQEQSSDDW